MFDRKDFEKLLNRKKTTNQAKKDFIAYLDYFGSFGNCIDILNNKKYEFNIEYKMKTNMIYDNINSFDKKDFTENVEKTFITFKKAQLHMCVGNMWLYLYDNTNNKIFPNGFHIYIPVKMLDINCIENIDFNSFGKAFEKFSKDGDERFNL
ncbi:hypothetical protein ACY1J9_001421 [Clostridium botulinum]